MNVVVFSAYVMSVDVDDRSRPSSPSQNLPSPLTEDQLPGSNGEEETLDLSHGNSMMTVYMYDNTAIVLGQVTVLNRLEKVHQAPAQEMVMGPVLGLVL